jgi:hypothetical protein
VQRVARPLTQPRGTQRPGGLKRFGANITIVAQGGPGIPPQWFLSRGGGGTPSADEWPPYWACEKVFDGPPGVLWLYQLKIAAQLPGGIKPDFALIGQYPNVVMRVQSERYHQTGNYNVAAYDLEQRIQLERLGYVVVDVYPQHYIIDGNAEKGFGYLTGQAAIRTVLAAQRHEQRMNPRGTQTGWARG